MRPYLVGVFPYIWWSPSRGPTLQARLFTARLGGVGVRPQLELLGPVMTWGNSDG